MSPFKSLLDKINFKDVFFFLKIVSLNPPSDFELLNDEVLVCTFCIEVVKELKKYNRVEKLTFVKVHKGEFVIEARTTLLEYPRFMTVLNL